MAKTYNLFMHNHYKVWCVCITIKAL